MRQTRPGSRGGSSPAALAVDGKMKVHHLKGAFHGKNIFYVSATFHTKVKRDLTLSLYYIFEIIIHLVHYGLEEKDPDIQPNKLLMSDRIPESGVPEAN